MLYTLEDIEIWKNNGNKEYPSLLSFNECKKFLNKQYSLEQFEVLENDLIQLLTYTYKWYVVSSMNPLYPEWGVTTISIDVEKTHSNTNLEKTTDCNNVYLNTSWFQSLERSISSRKELLKTYFDEGGKDLSRKNENGILFSNDQELRNIEYSIYQLVNDNIKEILNILEKSADNTLVNSLLWVEKSDSLINFLFDSLLKGNEDEKNITLLRINPLLKTLNVSQQKYLFTLIQNNLLYFPSPYVRNKAISLLSNLTIIPNLELELSSELKRFIILLASSKQYSYGIPAKEIKEDLF